MASYNRVILLGNLPVTRRFRYLPSGMAVTDVGLAVNDRRRETPTVNGSRKPRLLTSPYGDAPPR